MHQPAAVATSEMVIAVVIEEEEAPTRPAQAAP